MRTAAAGAVMIGALLGGGWAAGAPASKPVWALGAEPLQVDARTLEANNDEATIVFEGQVVARQGELTLQADRLEVHLEPKSRAVVKVKARGSVRIQKEGVLAAGEDADYDAVTGVVVLQGTPKVWRDRDVIEGDRITLYLAENRSVVEGARAVLFPAPPRGGEQP